jgi:hypothetical protein
VKPPADARGNGLPLPGDAVAVALLPEHLVGDALVATREAGLAAFAVPTGAAPGFSLEFRQFEGPGARLFVDRADRELARQLISDLLAEQPAAQPGPPAGPVDEETWAGLVATFQASPDAAEGPVDTAPEPTPSSAAITASDDGWADITSRVVEPDASEPRYAEDDDHYIPPPPPPLPETDALGRAAWAGVLGVPVLLLLAVVLGWDLAGWPAFLLAAGFLAGFVTLIVRMGDRLPVDDGPDDGAVV